MANGGARPGAGRKSKSDEEKVRGMSQQAVISLYGSIEDGMQKLLTSGEPSLIKFVWEHAVGKPREKMDIDANVQLEQITGMRFSEGPQETK